MKRMLTLFFALTLLLSTVISTVACGNAGDSDEVTSNTAESASVSETEAEFFPDVAKKDYQGKEFSMIGFNAPGEWYYTEKTDGGALNDAIYAMNMAVEDYLNVDIVYTHLSRDETGGSGIYQKIEPSLMAGDDEYQCCLFDPFYSYYSMINNGLAYDLYTLPGIDLDQDYWNRNVIDSVAIGNHAYIGLSALCLYETSVFYCNKSLFADAKREIPYESVQNGTWTLDDLYALTEGLYVDSNGNGARDNGDTYGFASYWDSNMAILLQGADIYVGRRNKEGRIELALDESSKKLLDFYDGLYRFSNNPSVYFWGYSRRNDPTTVLKFETGRAYVTMDLLGTKYARANMDFRFGVLPVPKYSVAQESYAHLNWGRNFMVPSTIQSPEMVGDVLELMSYYSGKDVYEAYYGTVLGLHVSDTSEDHEMVSLVCNTIVFDPAMPWCDNSKELKNLIYIAGFGPLAKYENITAYIVKNKKQADRFLRNMFLDLEE